MATPIPDNQCSFTCEEIRAAIGSGSALEKSFSINGISIDSRATRPGMLFVALRGIRDGHDFIDAAAANGASAAIVERGRASFRAPCFEVEDTLAAMGELARAHLQRLRRTHALATVAIGGAAGKTTTKELTAALMRALYGEIVATPGNLNNLIGVPMTAFMVEPRHRAVVLECGTNRAGEIARLSAIVAPDVALVLNVDIEHTEGLGSLDGVADEEAALFAHARYCVVGMAEEKLVSRLPRGKPRLSFGTDVAADVRLASRTLAMDGSQLIELELSNRLVTSGTSPRWRVRLKLVGASAALNAAAAFAAALASLARPAADAELESMVQALAGVTAVEGRLRVLQRGAITVIDDSYNSNPRSLRAALEAAREIADSRRARLIVAIGDMLELGALAHEMHSAALGDIAAATPDACLLAGAEFLHAAKADSSKLPQETALTLNSEMAATRIRGLLREGDVLLVKGSRGVAMERVIAALPVDS